MKKVGSDELQMGVQDRGLILDLTQSRRWEAPSNRVGFPRTNRSSRDTGSVPRPGLTKFFFHHLL